MTSKIALNTLKISFLFRGTIHWNVLLYSVLSLLVKNEFTCSLDFTFCCCQYLHLLWLKLLVLFEFWSFCHIINDNNFSQWIFWDENDWKIGHCLLVYFLWIIHTDINTFNLLKCSVYSQLLNSFIVFLLPPVIRARCY